MKYRYLWLLIASGFLAPSVAVQAADWVVMSAQKKADVAKGRMKIVPSSDWNRSSSRPSKRGESWTKDGFSLNELTFYAGIKPGEPIFRPGYEAGQKLPKFKADMLPTDLVEMFEASNRILLQSSVFKIELTEPVKLGKHDAVRFRYSYAAQDEDMPRTGEAVAAIVGGELYLVNFVAPSLHFFERDIDEVRRMVSTIELVSEPKLDKK